MNQNVTFDFSGPNRVEIDVSLADHVWIITIWDGVLSLFGSVYWNELASGSDNHPDFDFSFVFFGGLKWEMGNGKVCLMSDLRRVLPVHGVDGGGRRDPRVHVHQLWMGWIAWRHVFHAPSGMVRHVCGTRMIRARGCTPASNFGCRVGHEIRIKESVGLLRMRRKGGRFTTTAKGVRVFHGGAGRAELGGKTWRKRKTGKCFHTKK